MLQWILANWQVILSVVLGIDYALQLVFPASGGVGQILSSIGKFIHDTLGINPPAPPAAAPAAPAVKQ